MLSYRLLYFFFFLYLSFYSKLYFSINSFRNTLRVSNILDPYQAQRCVGPDMGQNCFLKNAYCYIVVN